MLAGLVEIQSHRYGAVLTASLLDSFGAISLHYHTGSFPWCDAQLAVMATALVLNLTPIIRVPGTR